MPKKKVLLHVCCGICAYEAIKRLKEQDFLPTALFFNPNIYPYSEYIRRREVAEIVASKTKIDIVESPYDSDLWQEVCGKYSQEKEGQRRCFFCYELRLGETFKLSKDKGFDYFTTTLTISSHKVSADIFKVGRRLGQDRFLEIDFKKKEGFKKSLEAAKKLNLYRQNYCGCIYSKKVNEE